MIRSIIGKDLRLKRVSLVMYCLSGALLIWLYIALFPSLQAQSQELNKLYATMPKGVLKAFGADSIGINTLDSFLAGKQFGLLWPILAIILMLSFAANAIAGEVEKGTISTILSQPITRSKVFVAKYMAGVLALILFVLTTVTITIPIAQLYHIEYSLKFEMIFSVACVLLGTAVLSTGMLLSAWSRQKSTVYGFVGGAVAIMFACNIIASLKDSLAWLRYGSVFYYFNAQEILVHHHINLISVLVLAGISILGFVMGIVSFNKRDIIA